MVRFGQLSVTLSNACGIHKLCRQHYTVKLNIDVKISRLSSVMVDSAPGYQETPKTTFQ
jgi:hypothetical protein